MCAHCSISQDAIPFFAFNLEGKAEKNAFRDAVESQRLAFEETWIPIAEEIIMSIWRTAADAAEAHGSEDAVLGAVANEIDAIEDLYTGFFLDVIPHFAAETFGGLKEWLPPLRKQDEDPWVRVAQQYADDEVSALGSLANATLRNQVGQVLREGLREGQAIRKMRKRLIETGAEKSEFEAARIIRTEVSGASSYGSFEGAQATGLPLNKEWLSATDGRVRDSHLVLNGEAIPMEEYFTVGGDVARWPGDTMLSASERIQCRCALAFIVVEA